MSRRPSSTSIVAVVAVVVVRSFDTTSLPAQDWLASAGRLLFRALLVPWCPLGRATSTCQHPQCTPVNEATQPPEPSVARVPAVRTVPLVSVTVLADRLSLVQLGSSVIFTSRLTDTIAL